jgi:hypothetical protein
VGLLITLALGLVVVPLAAHTQRPVGIPRIGVLRPLSATDLFTGAFRQGLRDLGSVEGHNIRLEYRCAEVQYKRLPAVAADLVQLLVDMLARAARRRSVRPRRRPRRSRSSLPLAMIRWRPGLSSAWHDGVSTSPA